MNQRDSRIIALAQSGLSARKIRERLALEVSTRQVQRIVRRELGAIPPNANSFLYSLDANMRIYVEPLMTEALGKDPHMCEICGERQQRKCDIHHKKYEGATLYDLQFVCRSCNLAHVNMGLA